MCISSSCSVPKEVAPSSVMSCRVGPDLGMRIDMPSSVKPPTPATFSTCFNIVCSSSRRACSCGRRGEYSVSLTQGKAASNTCSLWRGKPHEQAYLQRRRPGLSRPFGEVLQAQVRQQRAPRDVEALQCLASLRHPPEGDVRDGHAAEVQGLEVCGGEGGPLEAHQAQLRQLRAAVDVEGAEEASRGEKGQQPCGRARGGGRITAWCAVRGWFGVVPVRIWP